MVLRGGIVMMDAKEEYAWMKSLYEDAEPSRIKKREYTPEESEKISKSFAGGKNEGFEDIINRYVGKGLYYKTNKGIREIKSIGDAFRAAGVSENVYKRIGTNGLKLQYAIRLALVLEFTKEDVENAVDMAKPSYEEQKKVKEIKHWVKELIIINKKYKAPEELDQKIDVESVMELLENNNLIHQKEEQSRASRVK